MYGLPVLAIVCVLPQKAITGVSGFMDAVSATFTVYGGAGSAMTKIAAAGFILAIISSACTWLMGSDRSQAVASYDGAGPRVLGTFSARFGTPINVNFLSGIFSTIVFIVASEIGSGSAASTFNVMIGVVVSFTTLSYIVIFPALIKLRYSHPNVRRPFTIPGGMVGVWICGVLTTFWALFASIVAVFPGFLDHQFLNNADLPGRRLPDQVRDDLARRHRRHHRRRPHLLRARREDARGDGRRAARGQRGRVRARHRERRLGTGPAAGRALRRPITVRGSARRGRGSPRRRRASTRAARPPRRRRRRS